MSLADELRPSAARIDKVEQAYLSLGEADRVALAQALLDPSFTGPDIARALNKYGHNLDAGQINHYRRKLREGKASL
ncbi:hypothetical protein [Glutamicibacter creatinolyticus]|uniref:hypothetical protein n=1 Tax=Glutamicibacter creatinolyticus TaxID=162496 RepID=UPI0032180F6B